MCLRALGPEISIVMDSSSIDEADCINEVSQKSREIVSFFKVETC